MTTRERKPNERLAALMAEAGVSNKGLARRMVEASQRGAPVSPTHTTVARYLSGEIAQPADRARDVLRQVFESLLGRAITDSDLGYASTQPVSNDYPDTVREAIASLERLATLESDAASRALLVMPQAWSTLLVNAMLGPDEEPTPCDGAHTVTEIDVQAVRDATTMFATFDYRYGGGQPKPLVAKYLESSVLPCLRHVDPANRIGAQYFQAVAGLTRLAGWTAYDIGEHGLAQRYLALGFRLARAADDSALCGRLLACMSHQANFLGHFKEATHLARGAMSISNGSATPTAMALFSAMEARALASSGDELGTSSYSAVA